jgi:ABC-type hemin transport system substrate-binding protein
MGHRTTRMALGRQRLREARVQRLLEQQAHRDRVEEALNAIGDAYPQSREARAVWLHLEQTVGQAMLRLAAERILLSEMAARTGLPAGECRRLMRVARASCAPDVTEGDRY